MQRLTVWAVLATALMLTAGATQSFAQSTFKFADTFKVGSASFSKGEYTIKQKDDSHLTLKQVSTGKVTDIVYTKRLPQTNPPVSDPQVVLDVVGDFAPSYTDYITDYVLSEVWFPGADGYEIHEMKGAHQTKIIKGEK